MFSKLRGVHGLANKLILGWPFGNINHADEGFLLYQQTHANGKLLVFAGDGKHFNYIFNLLIKKKIGRIIDDIRKSYSVTFKRVL